MRILIVSDTSSHMRGGVPAETRTLMRALINRGHTVGLLADAPMSGVNGVIHSVMKIPVSHRLQTELKMALSTFAPDFVHVMSMSSKGLTLARPVLRDVRWAVTIHSLSPYERKVPGWHAIERCHYAVRWARFLPNTLLWRFALANGQIPRVIVHSRFVESIARRYGFPAERLETIPLPFESIVDPLPIARAPAPGQPIRLVTVGGLAHTKGQHDLVKALPAIRQIYPNVTAQLIGEIRDSSYVDWLTTLARRLGVEDHLHITPNLDNEGKEAALRSATVYVQPSHEEGFCLAYAEATAIVPRLVGTDTGAIAAISAHDAGARVVPARDPAALARAIIDVAGSDLPDDHFTQRQRRLAALLSLATYIEAHERIYAAPGR